MIQEAVLKTLDYYADNADEFATQTQKVDFSEIRNKFIEKLPAKGVVLDFGCGAGRDTKAFVEVGLMVEAWDGSPELCSIASRYAGIQVKHHLFNELSEREKYDGIWACASILHLPLAELKDVLRRIVVALKCGGIFYTSFKYGNFEGQRNGRYFTDMTAESLAALLEEYNELEIIDEWQTGDVRVGRENEQWLNIIMRKNNI
ncbi:Tellurite resistance protein-related protein [Anaerovibrio sp. JC8]|uniref:class I SAM-dependent methyltransferase n=1 Tax=Anaerovibrio sp. JC8 TaxID=1240085 RepID=UPI000A0C64B1|nr:class I SAM-dependent methyltransferase [Anaerovibrio sp. JC8]ORT99860.1 Tellurite resistance protein-related protein [Anaerovibrio sp. JC8]